MKKLILTGISSFFCLLLLAQGEVSSTTNDFLRAGSIYAGGTISFLGSSSKIKYSDGEDKGPGSFNMSILPEIGYVLNDRFAVALAIGYASSSSISYQEKIDGSGDDWKLNDKDGLFVINPMFKTYKKLSNRLYCMPSLGLSLGFGSGKNEYVDYDFLTGTEELASIENKNFEFGVDLRAALKFFPSPKWALSFSYGSVYYNTMTRTSKEDENDKITVNSYGLDLSLSSVRVGAYYFFN